MLAIMPACSGLRTNESTSYLLRIEAGHIDRVQSVVTFAVPSALKGRELSLEDENGRLIAVQRQSGGDAAFLLDRLAAGETLTYTLRPAGSGNQPLRIGAARKGSAISFMADGKPVLSYQAEETELPSYATRPVFRRGGYLHPVFTPSGVVITDDYPPNHLHHHGIWSAWTKTEFDGRHPDFWNMGDSTGTVIPEALDTVWSGPVHAGLIARHRYVDLSAPLPLTALTEQWEVTVYPALATGTPAFRFDLALTQQTHGGLPLVLPEYRYGGVGFRGHRQWDGAGNTIFLTSEGKTGADGHGTRARWCYIGGRVDGRQAGIVVLDHPDNFRFPQPMRIHPTEPFFNYAPSQAGDWAITPDEPYRVRYRYISLDGEPSAAEINRIWEDFAHPVAVKVTPLERR